jgi:hypothetical protein
MPDAKNWTNCKKCNRVLYVEDADKDGLCEDCREKPAPRAKEPKKA